MKKAVLKNFAIFTGKLQTCNSIKKRLKYKIFPLNIAGFFKSTYFEEYLLTAASDFLKQLQSSNVNEVIKTILDFFTQK